MGRISAKTVVKNKLHSFNRFKTNFGHFGRKPNYCVVLIYFQLFDWVHSNIFLAEIRLKTVERAQLNVRHRFWSDIVQVGRNFSKLAEFLPNRRRKNQPWVEFRPTWTVAKIQLRVFDRF
jgi:hypothetical protein